MPIEPIAKIISKVGELFDKAPKQVKALYNKILQGKDTNGKAAKQVSNYLFNKGAKQHEADSFVQSATSKIEWSDDSLQELKSAQTDPQFASRAKALLATPDSPSAAQDFTDLIGIHGSFKPLHYAKPGSDPYVATFPPDGPGNFAAFAPKGTSESQGYTETSYVLPRSLLQPHMQSKVDHFGNDVGTHARMDYTPKDLPEDTGRVIEVQSDAVNESVKKLHNAHPIDLYNLRPPSKGPVTEQRIQEGHDYISWLNTKRSAETSPRYKTAKYEDGVKGKDLKALYNHLMEVRLSVNDPSQSRIDTIIAKSMAIDKEIRNTTAFKEQYTPFTANIKWAQDTINRTLVDMANHGKKNIDFLISDTVTDETRAVGVRHWYKTDYAEMVKSQAKKIGAKVEEVFVAGEATKVSRDLTDYLTALTREHQSPGVSEFFRAYLVKTLKAGSSEAPIMQDLSRLYSQKTGIPMDELDKFNGLNEMIQAVGYKLNPDNYVSKSKYLRVKLAVGTTGAVTAFSMSAFADENSDSKSNKGPDMNPNDPAERINTIQGLLANGSKTKDIQESLVKNMGETEGNALMLKALQPKIEGLKKQGVSEEDINKSLQAHGLQLPGPSPEATSGGQLESPTPPSLPGDPVGQTIPDEQVQQLARATTESLVGSGPGFGKATGFAAEMAKLIEFHKDLVLPDGTSLSEAAAQLDNVTMRYSTLGKQITGIFSAADADAAAKEQQLAHDIIKTSLADKGFEVNSIGQYGEVIIKNKKTGELEQYDSSMMDTLLASAYEVGLGTLGGIGGAMAGLVSPVPGGAIIGGVLGSVLGTSAGRGIDVVRNAMLANYQVDMAHTFSAMNDAGVADATLNTFGLGIGQIMRGTYRVIGRVVQKGFDLVKNGNIEGAFKTVLTNTRLNETQARELVNKWAAATGNEGLSSGALSLDDQQKVIRVLGDTSPELSNFISGGAINAKTGGSNLRAQLDTRAKDLITNAAEATSDNISTTVISGLDNYVTKVNAFFDETKKAGIEGMKDSSYTFDFDATTLLPALKRAAKGITNPSNKKEFFNYIELIRDAGGKPIGSSSQIAVNKQATVAARTEVSAARAKATQLRAERFALKAKATAAKKRAKLLKTKKAQDRATAEAEGYAANIAVLDKQILKATDTVSIKAANTTSSIRSTAKAQQPQVQASAPRSFENLLQLKAVLNNLSTDSRFTTATDFAQMRVARESVDIEIVKAANQHMSGGKAWVQHWKAANTEYHNMKELEKNTLFKALISDKATSDSIVKAFSSALSYEGPKTFMQVMAKLPPKVRPKVEGAVFQHFVQKAISGDTKGTQAINFPQLAIDLDKIAFTQPEIRDLKRTVKQLADVFRADSQLYSVTANAPMPMGLNTIGTSVTMRAKMAVMKIAFTHLAAHIPGSNAGRASLVLQLGKVMDNPLSNQSLKALKAQLPNDPELDTALHQLAVEFTKFGKPEHYGKVPIYRVHKTGQAGKSSNTMIGKGVLYYTDKTKAQRIAKQTGAKVQEIYKVHKSIATPEVVAKIIGHTPSAEDFKDPEVLNVLKQTYEGLAVDDKVVLFK